MIFSDLVTRVRANHAGRTDKDDVIKFELNSGLKQICKRHRFKQMIFDADMPITATVGSVQLPAASAQILELRLINGTQSYKLPLYPKQTVVDMFPNTDAWSTGYPIFSYEELGYVYMAPRPTSAWVVRGTFKMNPAPLVNTTDEPVVPDIEDALVAFATGKLYASIEKFTEGSYWNGMFEKALAALIEGDALKPGTTLAMKQHNASSWQRRPIRPYGSVFQGNYPYRRY